MTSTGSRASLPNIRKNGEYPVVACLLVLYAMQTFCRWYSQSRGCCSVQVDSICKRVQLYLSIRPSDWGWYGVVLVFSMLSSLHTWANISDSNCRPWSECNCSGREKRQNSSLTNLVATVVASWLGIGYASIQ